MAVCPLLATTMFPAGVKSLVAGSKISAEARLRDPPATDWWPPARRTFPPARRVAVAPMRPSARVASRVVKVFRAGSYSSAEARAVPWPSTPPAMSTFPVARRVAVCCERPVASEPGVRVQVPVAKALTVRVAGALLMVPISLDTSTL